MILMLCFSGSLQSSPGRKNCDQRVRPQQLNGKPDKKMAGTSPAKKSHARSDYDRKISGVRRLPPSR